MRERAKGERLLSTPAPWWRFGGVLAGRREWRSLFQALLHDHSRSFCLLHHLFFLETVFHLCIHLHSKKA